MAKVPTKATSANEVLANTRDDHQWVQAPEDINTTGGIQRAIKAQWAAIKALADYIDGVATGTTDDQGNPVKVADPVSSGKSPSVSPPAAPFYQAPPASSHV
jgi:hypothetical protein